MVNVLQMIQRKKAEFRQAQIRKGQMENVKRAEELRNLREERLRYEGRAKLETARQTELARIESAKAKTPGTLQKFGAGLAAVINRDKKKSSKTKSSSKGKGVFFGSTTVGGTGSTGVNFGGNREPGKLVETKGLQFGGAGSPFNAAPKQKKNNNIWG